MGSGITHVQFKDDARPVKRDSKKRSRTSIKILTEASKCEQSILGGNKKEDTLETRSKDARATRLSHERRLLELLRVEQSD